MTARQRENVVGILEIATGVGILAFWMLFFTVGLGPTKPPACYFAFEHAFPLPDTVLAVALISSGFALKRGTEWGRSLSFACAGGLIFLGLLDFSFSLLNGVLSGPALDVIVDSAINLWCITAGATIFTALNAGRW